MHSRYLSATKKVSVRPQMKNHLTNLSNSYVRDLLLSRLIRNFIILSQRSDIHYSDSPKVRGENIIADTFIQKTEIRYIFCIFNYKTLANIISGRGPKVPKLKSPQD